MALLGAMTVRARYDEVNPYAFAPAIAPHIAAREAGVSIDFDLAGSVLRASCPAKRFDHRRRRRRLARAAGRTTQLRGSCRALAARRHPGGGATPGLPEPCPADGGIHRAARPASGGLGGNAVDPGFERPDENLLWLGARIGLPAWDFPYSVQFDIALAAKILSPTLRNWSRSRVLELILARNGTAIELAPNCSLTPAPRGFLRR